MSHKAGRTNVGTYAITERDETGRFHTANVVSDQVEIPPDSVKYANRTYTLDFIKKVFLPSGYPHSVSPDYLRITKHSRGGKMNANDRYQILNALQAFCSSLAGLLSSRAVLEGFGVGDPSATATHALLLTVVQDVFSRFTTIFGAYIIGSSLVPEAKTYRFLADILNDAAVILDTLSPLLNSPFLPFRIPGLRVGALCLSASCRALCGIAAGGSKAAISLHFVTLPNGSGDVGDLNAKDSSKETVLALLGMLLGTLIVPRLNTAWSTYTALFLLVTLHLIINYMGVRGLTLRSLNRQRLAIAWESYRSSGNATVPSPAAMANVEKILGHPGVFRDAKGRVIGHCSIGSSFSDLSHRSFPSSLFGIFEEEHYLIWFDHICLAQSHNGQTVRGVPYVHIFLKDGYTVNDQLKAWTHAAEVCRTARIEQKSFRDTSGYPDDDNALTLIRATFIRISKDFPAFIKELRSVGWNMTDAALMTGSPKAVLTGIESGLVLPNNDKNGVYSRKTQ